MLANKSIAIVTNHTGLVMGVHLVDTLKSRNVKINVIFCPEHGFRGDADAGQHIDNSKDTKTGIPIVSLYGNKKKPTAKDLADVEILLFDLQDVGVRYYTYISTLHYIMEAAAENQKHVIVLDRPNPNGFYIDGPVLDTAFRSFVGMHPIPVVYGMTIGELGKMINGEGWLKNKKQCRLTIVECLNYTHQSRYVLPVPPSPNLRNMAAVYLYPSLGFFEGTVVSAGRGTDFPFQVYGHPLLKEHPFEYTPKSVPGATSPKFLGNKCYGEDLRNTAIARGEHNEIALIFLVRAYQNLTLPDFFNSYFRLLAGNNILRKQIEEGVEIGKIRESWQPEIEKFKVKREKYLLYP
jgi:uncharacterized protein YbbC (DUF1343 family)